jgi:hypothetical protein
MERVVAVLVIALGACATAGGAGGDDDTGDDDGTLTPDARAPDASENVPIDAEVPDAAPMAVTLSQSNSLNIVDGNSPACIVTATGVTRENSYYRLFSLADYGVTGPFTAKTVSFGIEESTAQTVEVKLYTLSGAFQIANLTPLHTQSFAVPAVTAGAAQTTNVTLTTPVAVPAGAQLVVEVHVLDGQATNAIFFIGSNTAGESGASYIRATTCSINEPATMASQGFAQVHVVLTVSGTTP